MFSDDEMTSWKLALKPGFNPSALLLFNWFNYFLNFSVSAWLIWHGNQPHVKTRANGSHSPPSLIIHFGVLSCSVESNTQSMTCSRSIIDASRYD